MSDQITKKDNLTHDSEIMVSVIVLTYNHETYIAQALESILMQKTDFPFEILVGDDSSTDRTLEIVEEYQKKNPGIIRIIRHEKNVGAARNAYDTVTTSTGRYLANCEGDDYWTDPYKLKTQVEFLENHHEFIGCTHQVTLVDKNGEPLPHEKLEWVSDKKIFTLKDFRGIMLPGHVVSLLRRNLLLDKSFDPTILYEAEQHITDRTQALIWLSAGDFYQMDQNMACHRTVRHGSNLTSKLYFDNRNRIKRDYDYTLALEKYADETLKIDAGFDLHKRVLFVKNLVLHAIHPKLYDLDVAKDILKNADDKAWYWKGIIPIATRRFRHDIKSVIGKKK